MLTISSILVILEIEVLEEYGETEKLGQPVALEVMKSEADVSASAVGALQQQQAQPSGISGNNFYGNKPQAAPQQQQQQAPQRNLPSRSNGASSGSHGTIYPIEALSPYGHKWTIKARVTSKGEIKTWHNKNGEGKLFSVNFLDESGEIRATGFNDAVDSWYDVLQEGSVYYVSSPCKVQLAKKQFSNVNNDYELTFERDTVIEKAEDSEGVPQLRFNFTTLSGLQTVDKDTTIDTIGILKEVGEVAEIIGKNSAKPYNKRELTLVDNTGFSVRLTIWGKTAQTFDAPMESVIAFKGVKVSDFGGRSLSLLSSGTMNLDPDIDEAHKLKGWYDAQGRNDNFQSHASTMGGMSGSTGRNDVYKNIGQIKDEQIGMSEQAEYFTTKGTIIYVKQENFCYPACLSEGCNKKVVETDVGEWRCEKCDKTHPKPDYRYIMSVNVSDHTGQMWLSCFDEVGRIIMGMSADDLMQMKEDDDKAASDAFAEANCKTLSFRCRAKMDNYQEQQRYVQVKIDGYDRIHANGRNRVRYQVMSANPLNYANEAKKLADLIKQYTLSDGGDGLFVN